MHVQPLCTQIARTVTAMAVKHTVQSTLRVALSCVVETKQTSLLNE
jgi:hypothetical protein